MMARKNTNTNNVNAGPLLFLIKPIVLCHFHCHCHCHCCCLSSLEYSLSLHAGYPGRSKGPFKWFQHSTNLRSTKVDRMLGKCWTSSIPFNIFENKGNVVWILSESLSQFKFDSTHFQQAFNNVEKPVQMPLIFGSTKC